MSGRKCKVEGCNRKVHAKGLCPKHYQRLQKHGSTERDPKGQRVQDKIAFAYELLRQYAPELLKEEVNGTDNLPETK